MSRTGKCFQYTLLSTVIIAASTDLHAEGVDDSALKEDNTIGITEAQQQSIQDKKQSTGIIDTLIAADTSGYNTPNLADALGRTPGVSIDKAGIESTWLNIRGLTAELNRVTLNGQGLTSTSFDRAVDITAFPAAFFSRLEVIKTPSADHTEGALGASINLVTAEPLSLEDKERTVFVQANYNSVEENYDHRLQFSISEKLLNDTLGLTLTLVDDKNTAAIDDLHTGILASANPGIGFAPLLPANYSLQRTEESRQGASLAAQWSLSTKTSFLLDFNHTQQKVESTSIVNEIYYSDLLPELQGGDDKTNSLVSLKLNHQFSDRFRMHAMLGQSASDLESRPERFIIVASESEQLQAPFTTDIDERFASENNDDLYLRPTEPEPWYPEANDSNLFSPYRSRNREATFNNRGISVEDTLTQFQVDFDVDIALWGINTLEFGGKVSQREKHVDDQSIQTTKEFTPGGWVATSFIEVGTGIVNEELSLGTGFVENNTEDFDIRDASIDSNALYLKTRFAFFDNRLTGDLGFRYVKTNLDSEGFAELNFWTADSPANGGEVWQRDFDFVKLRELRDTSLPPCRALDQGTTPETSTTYHHKYQRVDGFGWDTSKGSDPASWTIIENSGECHDPAYAAWVEDNLGSVFPSYNLQWVDMWRYADISTLPAGGWDSSTTNASEIITWNGVTDNQNASNYSFINPENNKTRTIQAKSSHSYSNLLPSLNLRFAFTDTLLGRLAVSKTMARPEFEATRAGFKMVETGSWNGSGSTNQLQRFNPQLSPLESKNIDIALEWYFNDSSLLGITLFQKDVVNFSQAQNSYAYIQDLRTQKSQIDVLNELSLEANDDASGGNYGLEGCMPMRGSVYTFLRTGSPAHRSDDLRDLCGQYLTSTLVNGTDAEIEGAELSYAQTYRFLPGYFLSGLGIQANYSYQTTKLTSSLHNLEYSESNPVTPEHIYNLSTYWEQDGHQVRLSYRSFSEVFQGGYGSSGWTSGTLWYAGRETLDLSAIYRINKLLNVTFEAANLTNEPYRQYVRTRQLTFNSSYETNNSMVEQTLREYKTGQVYRLGLSLRF